MENDVYEIIGVVARAHPSTANLWLSRPHAAGQLNRSAYHYQLLGKLKAGVTLQQAQAELTTLGRRLAEVYPENRDKTFYASTVQTHLVGKSQTMLWLLLGAVGLVLAIACANMANLLLARASGRAAEFAVRTAVGAGRGHLIGQVLAECVAIGIAATFVGLALAEAGVHAMSRLAAAALPRWDEVQIDWGVFAFATVTSITAAVLAGLVPAWRSSQVDVSQGLRTGGSRGLLSAGPGGFRTALVVA